MPTGRASSATRAAVHPKSWAWRIASTSGSAPQPRDWEFVAATITGPKELMEYLRLSARRYVFSGTLPAGIPAAVSQALATANEESNGFSGKRLSPRSLILAWGPARLSRSAQQAAEPRFFDTFRPTGLDNTFAVARIGEIGKAR